MDITIFYHHEHEHFEFEVRRMFKRQINLFFSYFLFNSTKKPSKIFETQSLVKLTFDDRFIDILASQ